MKQKASDQFQIVKFFLESDRRNRAYLAFKLGYSSTSVIDKWLERKKIPAFRIPEIMQAIIQRRPDDLSRSS